MATPGMAAPEMAGQPMANVSRPTPSHAAAPASPKAKQVSNDGGTSQNKELSGDHMLIFTGDIHMEVDKGDISSSIDKVVDLAVERGGYVSKQDDRSVTVRVPSKHFRGAMREMEKVGDVTHRGVQAQDVSEEYHDLGIRLKSLKATRKRLEKFLDRAKSIQEVLRVEQELSRLNGEIDRLEGRMRFLAQRASFSTITVAFAAKPDAPKKIVKDPDPPPPPPPVAPRTRPLPIDWLKRVGLSQLMNLETED